MNTKVIIIGTKPWPAAELGHAIERKDDSMSVAHYFTTDDTYDGKETETVYYLSPEEVHTAYKNNVLLYTKTVDDVSMGMTMDSFYNDNVFIMDMEDFNSISEKVLAKNDIIVVWCDTKHGHDRRTINHEILETKYLMERLEYISYMYFLDEDPEHIADIILEYVNADEMRRTELLEENI